MGDTGQPSHPDLQNMMERGVKTITGAKRIAGLLQQSSEAHLQKMRQAATSAGQ
jgi:2-keto-3-deoxy-L-rhamnonate aldolase RhmA